MKLEIIFAEQQLLHLTARLEQPLQNYKTESFYLTKLAAGDMPAIDSYYHTGCLTALYNRLRSISPKEEENITTQVSLEAIALAELVAYIEDNAKQTVFKLSDLSKLYSSRLEQLGASVPERVSSTRVKERLLSQLPDLREYNEGREVKLAFSRTSVQLCSLHRTMIMT